MIHDPWDLSTEENKGEMKLTQEQLVFCRIMQILSLSSDEVWGEEYACEKGTIMSH